MIVAVTAWRGCGATTAALALATAAARDGEAWLVEADPAGGVLSGRIDLERSTIGGLERVAFPPQTGSMVEAFHEVAHHHGAVRVVSAPLDPFHALACHHPRADWVAGLVELDGTVVVDAGRVRAGATPWPLLAVAGVVVCVVSAEVSAVVATTEWLRVGGRVGPAERGLDESSVRVAIVDSPASIAFPRHTMMADLGAAYVGWLPWDRAGVDALHRGVGTSDRRTLRRPLLAGATQMLDALASTCRAEVSP